MATTKRQRTSPVSQQEKTGTKSKDKKSSKGKADKSKVKDIFVWVNRNERSDTPYLRGFVSIPSELIDKIEEMSTYDEGRDSYQLDIALFKKGNGVLSGNIKESWKKHANEDNDMDDELDEELDDDDDDDEYEEEEEEEEEEEDEPFTTPAKKKTTSRRPATTTRRTTRR
jgi:hypothetical protein